MDSDRCSNTDDGHDDGGSTIDAAQVDGRTEIDAERDDGRSTIDAERVSELSVIATERDDLTGNIDAERVEGADGIVAERDDECMNVTQSEMTKFVQCKKQRTCKGRVEANNPPCAGRERNQFYNTVGEETEMNAVVCGRSQWIPERPGVFFF